MGSLLGLLEAQGITATTAASKKYQGTNVVLYVNSESKMTPRIVISSRRRVRTAFLVCVRLKASRPTAANTTDW